MFPVSDVIPSNDALRHGRADRFLNALVFLYELQLSRPELQLFAHSSAWFRPISHGRTLVTSMFLHEGWLHLLGNMLYLWIFGDNVEDRLGHAGYLLFYFGCGSAAALGQVAVNADSTLPMIGASGRLRG